MGVKTKRNTEDKKEKRGKEMRKDGKEDSEKHDEMMRKIRSYYIGHA